MARPAWQVLGVLLAGVKHAPAPATPADAFALLGELRPEFAGLRFADLGANGVQLPRTGALAEAGSDQ
jgi:NADH-quinone oxidoreductase subunit G